MAKWDSDKIFSVSAFVISVATLVTLMYQSKIMREHEENSSFPKLELWNNNNDSRYQLYLVNTGLGPAIIEDIKVVYKDSIYDMDPARFARNYIDSMDVKYPLGTSTISKGKIIQPGGELFPINIRMDSIHLHPLVKPFNQNEFKVVIKYSSVYRQMWKLDGLRSIPKLIDEDPVVIEEMLNF